MKKMEIKLKHISYPIHIEKGLFQRAGDLIYKLFTGRKFIIITDGNVEQIYGHELLKQLRDLKAEAAVYQFPAGEQSKSHYELIRLYYYLAESNMTRKDVIIALGGGVTGDLAGYAASTWLRGTRFIQIPTSLLAMVDSGIGGKVAVNLSVGKNLVGSFYHPKCVLIDPLLLKTLPDRHFNDGMAEVIKYGCIADECLFKLLESMKSREAVMEQIEEIVFRCCDIKRNIVEEDERENNLRMILNFGHTFGHAIEKLFNYEKYTHGEAVSIGMVFIAGLSQKLGYCDGKLPERIVSLLKQFGLPVDFPELEGKQVVNSVLMDKKARTSDISLVLIKDFGKVCIESFPKSMMGGFVDAELNNKAILP